MPSVREKEKAADVIPLRSGIKSSTSADIVGSTGGGVGVGGSTGREVGVSVGKGGDGVGVEVFSSLTTAVTTTGVVPVADKGQKKNRIAPAMQTHPMATTINPSAIHSPVFRRLGGGEYGF
jgi:hypothetical protein